MFLIQVHVWQKVVKESVAIRWVLRIHVRGPALPRKEPMKKEVRHLVHLPVHLLVHLSVHLLHTLMMARPVLTRSILRAHQSPHLCCGSIIDDYRSDEADDLEPEEEGDANSENSRQDDDDQPLYSGCNVSSAQFDALLFAYFIKHWVPDAAKQDFMK